MYNIINSYIHFWAEQYYKTLILHNIMYRLIVRKYYLVIFDIWLLVGCEGGQFG